MYVDKFLEFSRNQALTAKAASTNVIDLGVDHDIGRGEPMAVTIHVGVSASANDGNETYTFTLQTDDNSSFSSATNLTSITVAAADLVAGYKFFIGVPKANERYLRMNYTLGGTTPTITLTSYLEPQNFIDTGSGDIYYPDGYTIV
jgi:hypothetical protein